MPNSTHLLDNERPCTDITLDLYALPVRPPILAPAPTETLLEETQYLSPLSNEYGFWVEWFDAFENSLCYAPPPPSPPPPRHHLSEATSTTSTDSPTHPLGHNHAIQEDISQALRVLAKGQ